MARQQLWRGKHATEFDTSKLDEEARKRGEWKYTYKTVTVEGTITVEVDLDWLIAQLGDKALRSKGGKSVDIGGAVVVKATNRKRTVRPR